MKKIFSIIGMMVLFTTISFAQMSITLGTVTMQPSDVGNIVNVPVIATQGASGIGSMQFKVLYDTTVLSPVSQSIVNEGVVNPHPATALGGWYAGVSGNAISPNWLDPTFSGVSLANGDTLFEIQFTFLGGSSNVEFDASNSYVYDLAYSPISLTLANGAVNEFVTAQNLTFTIGDLNLDATNIGDTVDVPVNVIYGDNTIGSIQLDIAFDSNVLSLVEQSGTNAGVVNAAAITLANAGDWVAGSATGSSIVCTWYDPTFAGVQLQDNEVLFELRFVYNGGSSAVSFNTANSYVFDASYSNITIILNDGMVTGAGVPAAPMAYTNAASAITHEAAMLNGVAVANNALTAVYFEYGTDATYGNTVYANEDPVTDSIAVTAPIMGGLQANTEYHFRVVCENIQGTAYGADMVFTTSAAPAEMEITIADFDATGMAGSTINVPVVAAMGYVGISSMQFSIDFDSTVVTPVVVNATNTGLVNPHAATIANAGSWMAGLTDQTINCNWFDPTFNGININTGDTLFEMQFSYIGGDCDIAFGTANFVYDAMFAAVNVDYINGSVSETVVVNYDLVITEIMYNPPESGADSLEFIEIYNNGADVDLTGLAITEGVVAQFPSIVLAGGDYIVFAVNADAMFNTFGVTAYQWTSGGLSNGGEDIIIEDAAGNVIDVVDFDDNTPWPTSPDGNGPSLSLCDPTADNALAANWSASTTSTGIFTDGNEILANPGAGCTVAPSYYAELSIADMNLSASDIGTIINIPVVMDMGYNGIGSMQFEIAFDDNVLTPVQQSVTNVGLVNPAAATTTGGSEWMSGNGTGSALVCNWMDLSFNGVDITSGTTLFELQFIYNGGSCDITFNATNSFVYDASYNSLVLDLTNGTLSGAAAPSAPMAYTEAASAIAHNEAMLNGIAVANNAITTAYFEYGVDATYGDTAFVAQNPINDSTAVSATISGLNASSTYHFRLVAENNMGVVYGADMTFTTANAPAQMALAIADFDGNGLAGTVVNVPVVATTGFAGISSMQFSFDFDSTVVTPVVINATNTGIANPLAATLANAGSWMSGVTEQTLNCNWFDPTFAGINVNTGDTLFELQFTYAGGSSDLTFGAANFVYDAMFAEVIVDYIDGSVTDQFIIPAEELFFSEYVEGSSNNKGLEIYNPTAASVSLDDYMIFQSSNGSDWQYYHNFPVGASVPANDVWVIVTDQISSSLFDTNEADEVLGYPSVVHFNGNDARALAKVVGNDTVIVDLIGVPNVNVSAWDVAGVANATKDHTLVRKSDITNGNDDWAASAGTDANNSEWEVMPQNTIGFGQFGILPFELDIADVTYTAAQVGDTVNVPVEVTVDGNGIASMQFEISFDNNVLAPVNQSATNTGIVNAAMETTANGGEWFAGVGAGNAISCNWYDPLFTGIDLTASTTLFELQFVYLGGSCDINFVANSNYVYDALYAVIETEFVNGSVAGEVVAAPLAYTNAASSISDVEATLNGVAVANNLQAIAYFEYGTDLTYGSTVAAVPSPVNDSVAVSAMISGLNASSQYYYRLVVENSMGTAYGADMTFFTNAPAAEMEIAIADFDATGMAGSTINVPVVATMGYAGISSMQFSIDFDSTVVTPVVVNATNTGIVNPHAATSANGGSWMAGLTDETINSNWFDPTFGGININSGDTLFELQFSYIGGDCDISFGTTNFVYDTMFAAVTVDYINGSVSETSALPVDLVITEIMYNPPESGTDSLEFIEIYNNGNIAADLTGYYFSDGVTGTFPSELLQAGDYILFAVDSVAMFNTFGVEAYQWTNGGLSNGGETIEISDAAGTIIDAVTYDDYTPWPTSADGNGPSLSLCDPSSDNADAANWSASATSTGIFTNGNEILANPGTNCVVIPTWDVALSITDMNLSASDIGTVINIPVVMDMGYNGIGSMQFEIAFDANALTPVQQSVTNVGLVNPAAATTAGGGEWMSGNGTGSALVCNWMDPSFNGVDIASGTTLFEMQFTYNGGSCDLMFNAANSFVYDATYNSLILYLTDGTLTGAAAPSAPMAYTEAASAIAHNEAMLNGIAVANNAITTAYFEYGVDATYGDTVYVSQNPINDSTVVSAMVQGLNANTMYHFRLVAENNLGVAYGSDYTFTTANAPAQMALAIADIDATGLVGTTINVPVVATTGFAGISSMQFSFDFDSTVVTPVVINATNTGIANPLAATLANAGSWMSGVTEQTLNCNWFDPTFAGINVNTGDTLFELQFTYNGGDCDLTFGTANFVYDALFAEVVVDYYNGSVGEQYVIPAQELFFSEYVEGSSNNKGLEIYNPTGAAVSLDDYVIMQAVNGGGWQYYHNFPAGASIPADDVWVIVADQISSSLFDTSEADEVLGYPSVVHFNGDDARALAKVNGTDLAIVDIIGDPNNDPGNGWDVAGVSAATYNHTLVRKQDVTNGTDNWAVSAGTDAANSEWIVMPQNTIGFGSFINSDFELDIADITVTATEVGDTITIPVLVTAGYNGVASMQFEINYNSLVLEPVFQSVTNTGIVNPMAATTAVGGEWFAGASAGAINCNWYDPTFAGIDMATGAVLFELQFIYQGGSSDVDFVATNCFAYDAAYVALDGDYLNGSVSGVTTSAPVVVTEGATNITEDSATLNGTVDPGNAVTVAYFEYGTTTAYGDTVYIAQGSLTSAATVTADIAGLMASTEYHYRLVAQNFLGTTYGADSVFTTANPPVDAVLQISEFDAFAYSPGDTINVPVLVVDGYNGVSSMQFAIEFDTAVVTPVVLSATNTGIANALAVTLANGGSWMSGVNGNVLSCNWFDPTFAGVNIASNVTLFELQFVYNGGEGHLSFNTTNSFVYNTAFTALTVDYIDGTILGANSHVLTLVSGWSIWSTYIDPATPNMIDIFNPIVNEVTIVKNGLGQVYWPYWGLNAIGDHTVGQGYQVKMSSTQTLDIFGNKLVPETTPLNLNAGWSIIGYIRDNAGNAATMMSGIVNDIIILKSGSGQVYWPAFGLNMIGDMLPGQGYQINLTNAATLTYPANTAPVSAVSKVSTSIQYFGQAANTGNNMTVCFPYNAWETVPALGSEIAVKNASGLVVGSAVYNGEHTPLTVWGADELSTSNDGVTMYSDLRFFFWNAETGNESQLVVEEWIQGEGRYDVNAIAVAGKLAPIAETMEVSYSIYPNPFVSTVVIELSLPETSEVTISLVDETGRLVSKVADKQFADGNHRIELNGSDLPVGTYQVIFETNNRKESETIIRVR